MSITFINFVADQSLIAMKKLSIVLVLTTVICAGVFSACSDEPEPTLQAQTEPTNFVKNGEVVQGKIDIKTLSLFSAELNDATYSLEDYALYNMDDYSNGLWEELDTHTLDGWNLPIPSTIILKEGMCWEPIRTFISNSGPTRFAIALDLIERIEQKCYNVYIKKAISTNEENLTVSIGNIEYGILFADSDRMVLSYEYPYYGGRTHNGGLEMCVAAYSLSEPLQFEGTAMTFDTETAAYDWIIGVFRDTFGESVNCNDYYNGTIILDNPMLYLSEIIAERDSLGGR